MYFFLDCSRPAVISDPTLLGDSFVIPVYGTFILWTLVNLRRGFSVGYFHGKSVPELVDAESTWDIILSSQHVNIRDYKELFPVITYQSDGKTGDNEAKSWDLRST